MDEKECRCEEAFNIVFLINKINPELLKNTGVLCKKCNNIIHLGDNT